VLNKGGFILCCLPWDEEGHENIVKTHDFIFILRTVIAGPKKVSEGLAAGWAQPIQIYFLIPLWQF